MQNIKRNLSWPSPVILFCAMTCCSSLAHNKSDLDSIDAAQAENLQVFAEPAGTLVHDYLMARAAEQFAARRQRTGQALRSPAAAAAYQRQVRQKYRSLIGSFGPKTPLNPVVTGTIACEDYRIEKVAYESLPHHYVTANLYLPTTGDGPWPGVLVLSGHADAAKAHYQEVCILLAKNGMVALIVDPISQGEMVQIVDENREPVMEDGVYIYSKKYLSTVSLCPYAWVFKIVGANN